MLPSSWHVSSPSADNVRLKADSEEDAVWRCNTKNKILFRSRSREYRFSVETIGNHDWDSFASVLPEKSLWYASEGPRNVRTR